MGSLSRDLFVVAMLIFTGFRFPSLAVLIRSERVETHTHIFLSATPHTSDKTALRGEQEFFSQQ